MAEFTLTLVGSADPDVVREAFNSAVQSVREAIDEGFELTGELVVNGETYSIGEVPEEAAADTDEEEVIEEVEEDEEIVVTTETETQA
jgi:hypothetical protein